MERGTKLGLKLESFGGRGKFFCGIPSPQKIGHKITIDLFSFLGSMCVNPLACPSRSRPNPPISVRNSSAGCRTSESMGDPKRRSKGIRARKVHGHPTVAVQKDRSYAGKR